MIETERLLMRTMTAEDTEALLAVFGDPNVAAVFRVPPFDLQQMTGWVQSNLEHQERHGYGLFTVVLKAENKVVGDCGLESSELDGQPIVQIGYDFASDYWGRGLATEAATAVRDYALSALGMTELTSLIQTHNHASMRVAEKLGMNRQRSFSHGLREYHVYVLVEPVPTGNVASRR